MNGTSMGSDNLNMKMLKPLDEVMRCPICSEFFNNCVMTSCCHDFCSVCIKRRMTTESDCPICYEDLREGDLRKNDSMDKIVRIYKKLTRLNAGRPSESQTQSTDQSQKSSCNSSGTLDDSQVQNTPSVESSSERMVPFQNRPRTQSTPLIHTIQPILSELTTPIKIEIDDCDDAEEDINVVSTSNRTSSSSRNNFCHKRKSFDSCEVESDDQNLGRGHRIKKRSSRYNQEDYHAFSSERNMVDLDNDAADSGQLETIIPDCANNYSAVDETPNVQAPAQLFKETTLVRQGEQMNSNIVAMNKFLGEQVLPALEEIKKDIKEVKENQVKILNQQIDASVMQRNANAASVLIELPEGIDFPISSDEALIQLDDRLRKDINLQCLLIHYFETVTSGGSISAFLSNLCWRFMTKELAKTYSRLGRKGKKCFENHSAVTNAILAATLRRFKDASRQEITERLGKVLSVASEWKSTKPKIASSDSESLLYLAKMDCSKDNKL